MSARSFVRGLTYFVAASLLVLASVLLVDAQRADAQTTSTIDQMLADPADSVVAIGDLVEYRIRIELSEGTAPLTLTNVMPTLASSDGVVSFQSGSVVSVGSGISTLVTVGSAPSSTDQIGFDSFDDTVLFDFGAVTVAAPTADADANVIVVEVVGLVVDIADNSGGDSLTNTATLAFGAEEVSDSEAVSIVEPKLTLDKESDLLAVAPGATIPYSVTIGHTFDSGAPAHDIVVSDILADSNLSLVGSVTAMIVGANGSPAPVVAANIPGAVEVSLASLNPGDQLVITYNAELSGTAGDARSFFNTATANYDSLSGLGGRPDSAVDRYRIATVAALFKAVESTTFAETEAEQGDPLLTDVGIGEEVSFTYEIFLPELELDGLVFTDQLPSTFNFGRAEVVEVGSDLMLQEVMQSPGGGLVDAGGTSVITESNGVVTIDFGAVTNNVMDDDVDNNERIVIRVTGSVGADAANVAGMQLINTAQIEMLNPDETATDPLVLDDKRTLDIVEPDLNINKTVTPTNADAGDVVTYTIHVAHDATSTGPAYDVVVTDPLLASLRLVNSSVVTTSGVITAGATVGDRSVRVDIPALDIGQSAMITFDATLTDAALFNSSQTNTATLRYSSHPGANATGERMYGPKSDGATISTPSPTITKTVVASSVDETAGSSLVVGEVVTFRTTIDMPEGSSPMTLISSLPTGGALSYRDARIVPQASNVSFSAAPTVATAGAVTTFDFNTVTVAGAEPTVGGRIVVEVDALVEDVAAVVNGAAFTNSAVLNFNGGLAEAEAPVAIVEPALTFAKSAPAAASPGARLEYSLTVNHSGASTAAAFDLVVVDSLSDPNLMLDTGSVSAAVGGVAVDPSAIAITGAGGQQGFAVRVDALLLGRTLVISYQAQLAADAPGATTFVNTATLAFDSVGVADQIPGAAGRSDAATASASTLSAPTPAVEKPVDGPTEPVDGPSEPVADDETLLAAIVARAAADRATPPPAPPAEREPAQVPARPPLAITGTTVTSTLGFGSMLAAIGFSCLGFARRRRNPSEVS